MARLVVAATTLTLARGLQQPHALRTLSRLRSAAKDALEQHTERVQTGAGPGAPSPERLAHNKRQQEVFDSAAEFFASPEASPPEVEATLDALAARICEPSRPEAAFRVLDVGSGTGCLSRRYDNAATGGADVTGVDLSPEMVKAARAKGGNPTYVVADIVDYAAEHSGEPYDAVVFNACFGNIFDRSAALRAAASVLAPGGRAVITHPLGAAFVDELHERDASVVPAGLPRTLLDMEELVEGTALTPAFVEDEVPYFSEFVRD
jgi:SAM-dependent methyltransferase